MLIISLVFSLLLLLNTIILYEIKVIIEKEKQFLNVQLTNLCRLIILDNSSIGTKVFTEDEVITDGEK